MGEELGSHYFLTISIKDDLCIKIPFISSLCKIQFKVQIIHSIICLKSNYSASLPTITVLTRWGEVGQQQQQKDHTFWSVISRLTKKKKKSL